MNQFVITLMVVLGLCLTSLNAQNTSVDNDFALHLGLNIVGDGAVSNRSENLFKAEYRNFSNPLVLGVEYFYNSKFSLIANASFNKYIANKTIDGSVLLKNEEANYVSVDVATKYHFLKAQIRNNFEPYVFLGLGYTNIGSYRTLERDVPSTGRFTVNAGFGVSYWLSNSFGINLNLAGEFGVKSEKYKEYISNQTQFVFGVFYHFKKKYNWRH